MSNKLIDLTGLTFGRLTVLGKSTVHHRCNRSVPWRCSCICGKFADVSSVRLRKGTTTSCGCYQRESVGRRFTTHGQSTTPLYVMCRKAAVRAKHNGLDFNIHPDMFTIPIICPVLGIPITIQHGRPTDNSPTLDRIDNTKGYVVGNVWIISQRANRIKNDATLTELKLLVAALEKHND